MKFYNKTLLEIEHKVELSATGTTASCWAASYHGTTEYGRQRVARHRAISKDVRHSISQLLLALDRSDQMVEEYFQKMLRESREEK